MDEETENAAKSGKATGQAVISLGSVINFPSTATWSILLSFCAKSGSGLGYLCGISDLHILGAVSPVLLCISVRLSTLAQLFWISSFLHTEHQLAGFLHSSIDEGNS